MICKRGRRTKSAGMGLRLLILIPVFYSLTEQLGLFSSTENSGNKKEAANYIFNILIGTVLPNLLTISNYINFSSSTMLAALLSFISDN